MINIKVKINGYLKEIDNNITNVIDTLAIKNNNKIQYQIDDILHKILINEKEITLIRENKEFKNILIFKVNHETSSKYLLKSNNFSVFINIYTNNIICNEDRLFISYKVLDSNTNYEYEIEMRKI